MKALWIDPCFGASGDMLLGALIGLGAEPEAVCERLALLGIPGWSINVSTALRAGLTATFAGVRIDHDHDHDHRPHRRWSEIDSLIGQSDLSQRVRDGARHTFRLLGEVEAAAHGVSIDEVAFHEVGAVDSIVDIVGVWIALDLLDVHVVTVGAVGLGHGTVRTEHGVLPLPAPATAALLIGAPVRAIDVAMETCTPTGAALLSSIGTWGTLPAGTLLAVERGAGGKDPSTHANVVTAYLFDTAEAHRLNAAGADAALLTSNIDDATPEVIGHTIERLLAAGADDAWVCPIVMKKSRPAFQLCALTTEGLAPQLREIISVETGTLGIRQTRLAKFALPRTMSEMSYEGHRIGVKHGPFGAKAEHADLAAAAVALGRPLRVVAAEVHAAFDDHVRGLRESATADVAAEAASPTVPTRTNPTRS